MRIMITSGRMIVMKQPTLEEVREEYLLDLEEEDRQRMCTDDTPDSVFSDFVSAWWAYEEVV
jgi:predicted RNase H-like nuclease